MSIAFMFPGQGSQEVGMLSDIGAEHSELGDRLEEASDTLSIDLADIVANGPAEELNRTEITQPALLTVSVALYDIWRNNRDDQPIAMAGHSLGEYSALTASGVFHFADAVRLVHERGKLMQAAVRPGEGSMIAILGLELEPIEEICHQIDGVVSPANLNAPGQVVLSGSKTAVEEAAAKCRESGARRAVPLDVSVPSHCSLMDPAASGVAQLLDSVEFHPAGVPVYHNVDAQTASDAADIRSRLMQQLSNSVRWSDCVEAMAADGATHLIECGPGRVLTGLVRRIDRGLEATSISTVDGLRESLGQDE